MASLLKASAKQNACMKKNAPGLQKDMEKREKAMKKAAMDIAIGKGTPTAKKEKLKTLVEKYIDGRKKYREAMVSNCMKETVATLKEVSKMVEKLCKHEKSNKMCKTILTTKKKVESGHLTEKDMREIEESMASSMMNLR